MESFYWTRVVPASLPVSRAELWSRCIRIRGFIMMGWEWFRLRPPSEARLAHRNMILFHKKWISSTTTTGRCQSSMHFDKFPNVPTPGGWDADERSLWCGGVVRSADEDGMVGWSSSCPLQHLRRMFVLAELINNWQKGRVADNWLPAENKNSIDPHTLMITEEATDGPGILCLCLQILWDENHDLAIASSSCSRADLGLRVAFKCLIQCHCPGCLARGI